MYGVPKRQCIVNTMEVGIPRTLHGNPGHTFVYIYFLIVLTNARSLGHVMYIVGKSLRVVEWRSSYP